MLRQNLQYSKNNSDIMFCHNCVMQYSMTVITTSSTHTAESEKWMQKRSDWFICRNNMSNHTDLIELQEEHIKVRIVITDRFSPTNEANLSWSADGCIPMDYFNYVSRFTVLIIYLIMESLVFIMWTDPAEETFSTVFLCGLIIMYY